MGEVLTLKFIVLGETGVGKSCIVSRFTENTFQQLYNVTVGVTFCNVMMHIDSQEIKLQIWDTAGQEIYRSITRSYYRESKCAFLVYDVTKPETFEALAAWVSDIKSLAPPDCQIVVVGNKIDLEKVVTTETGKAFAQEHNCPFFETSALTGENVREMFEECAMIAYASYNERQDAQFVEPATQRLAGDADGKGKKKRCC